MKVLSVLGTRPQFIKAAPLITALQSAGHTPLLVHTGQHYDYAMSQIFFDELGLPAPDVHLQVGSGSHGRQIGEMLIRLEATLQAERPDWVVVYGDTNSTLAGALAACKLRLPIAHVEAGLRSFNREMPEEHNRVLTDHAADLLLCPTQTAVEHLRREGIVRGVYLVGDIMYDAALRFTELAQARSTILRELDLSPGDYLLATVHRPYNADVAAHLRAILSGLREIGAWVVFPVHPRTRQLVDSLAAELGLRDSRVRLIEPVGYLDMLMLERHARLILTDSGGIQKEAYFFGVPCVTLRPETEWVETVESGWNVLVGWDAEAIVRIATSHRWPGGRPAALFGTGETAATIVRLLESSSLLT